MFEQTFCAGQLFSWVQEHLVFVQRVFGEKKLQKYEKKNFLHQAKMDPVLLFALSVDVIIISQVQARAEIYTSQSDFFVC
jgi:hypothetical protein